MKVVVENTTRMERSVKTRGESMIVTSSVNIGRMHIENGDAGRAVIDLTDVRVTDYPGRPLHEAGVEVRVITNPARPKTYGVFVKQDQMRRLPDNLRMAVISAVKSFTRNMWPEKSEASSFEMDMPSGWKNRNTRKGMER